MEVHQSDPAPALFKANLSPQEAAPLLSGGGDEADVLAPDKDACANANGTTGPGARYGLGADQDKARDIP
eukprot:979991-Alexandrium_andersonii.AAC.1